MKEAYERTLDICPIGSRTIAGDISDMRNDSRLEYFAPIKFDRYQKNYHYSDPDYSIDNLPINEDELESLLFAASLLNQFQNISYFKKFTGTVQKIVNAIRINRYEKDSDIPCIDFEKVEYFKGSDYIEPLIMAIREKDVLKIIYKAFPANEAYEYIVHPYLLKEYRNRWYLIAIDEEDKEMKIFGLDRIEEFCNELSVSFYHTEFDFKAYFANSIGITTYSKEPVTIELKFTQIQAQYIITKPVHSSQKIIKETKDHIHFSFCLVPTYEFRAMILGWAEAVEVITPEWYREEIRGIIGGMVRGYE